MQELKNILSGSAVEAAKALLGCVIDRTIDGERVRVRIVETEAYNQTDAASHSFKGRTPRTDVMFGPSGYWYVYFTYGMHYCCNIVTGKEGVGEAVLIRAVEPLEGSEVLEAQRGKSGIELTNGPAKLCQALSITKAFNGVNVFTSPLRLIPGILDPNEAIVQTTRIGISKAKTTPWRFYIKNNNYVSKK